MTNPIHPGDSEGGSPASRRGVPPAHKGPGKEDDGIPRDAAGETYVDRVRNVVGQLQAMDLDLQRIWLEHMAEEQADAEALAAANGEVPDRNEDPQSTDDTLLLNIDADEGRVVAGAAINREMMDDLTVAWNAYMTFGLRAPAHIHYMIQRVVEPLLVEWSEQAAQKGWFNTDEQGQD